MVVSVDMPDSYDSESSISSSEKIETNGKFMLEYCGVLTE